MYVTYDNSSTSGNVPDCLNVDKLYGLMIMVVRHLAI